jgi:cytochrome d ubiquinol oxidase subunit II
MDQQLLAQIWFFLLGALLAGYAILDGFDLGVGMLHGLVAKSDHERRLSLNSIGPLWDGNEVWLVTFGGALFAAFPLAYASVFSGLYTAFMALLFCLIFRAVSIEFRSKRPGKTWRGAWDLSFAVSSAVATLLFGVAVGNVMLGIPLSKMGDFTGALPDLLNPYALLVGLFAVSLFAMHGSIYLHMKTEGELQRRLHGWMWRSFGFFLVMFLLTTIFTLETVPHATENLRLYPVLWVMPVLNVLALANVPRQIHHGNTLEAFLSSSFVIVALVALLGVALYPNLVASSPNPENTLTVFNAASSQKTLGIMLLIAGIGMPLVLSYTIIVYRTFRGKVRLGANSY